MTKYLRNQWYIGGWDYEITRTLMVRTMLEEPVLMFRKENGDAVAMSNKCPHRYAPLHRGKLVGDVVQCTYHGLSYDSTGQCVHNPHPGGNGPIPPNSKIRAYPTVERMGAVWIWMGDAAPDESLLPDYGCIDDTASFRTIRGVFDVGNHYEMCTDNALDLTHVLYTHAGTLGSGLQNVANERVVRERVGNTLWCKRFNNGVTAGSDFQIFNPELQGILVDKQQNVRWDPPGNIMIVIRYVKAETENELLTSIRAGNMLVPVSETETRFFWSVSRTFSRDKEWLDEPGRMATLLALEKQDKPMIEDQLLMMGTTDLDAMRPVYLQDDATPIQARRVVKQLLEQENPGEREVMRTKPTLSVLNVS